jgi:hypothetical protein
MNNLRDTILVEQEIITAKSRFGLFSQPPPLAVGDDSKYLQKTCIKIIILVVKG